MQKSCRRCQSQFEITANDLKMLDELAPIIAGKKIELPLPTTCAPCRQQLHLSFRNEKTLYNRKSDLTGKEMISIFSPGSTFKVIDQEEWWSDQWNPFDYGKKFDFTKTLTEQLDELNKAIPHMALSTKNVENSRYTNFALNMKNCYLVFGAAHAQDCLYGKFIIKDTDVVDSLSVYYSELCYEGIALRECYNCKWITNCRNCSDSMFIEDCDGLKNSLLCFGVRNKEYYYMNQFIGKEKYEKIMTELKPLTQKKIAELKEKFTELKKNIPHIEAHIYSSEDCTGDTIFNSKNCQWSFDINNCENSSRIYVTTQTINSMDITYAAWGVRFSYQLCSATGCERSIGCFLCWDCNNTFYSIECQNSNNIFACIGLRQQQYCILNKQYTKAEYETLVPKIIDHLRKTGEWGEFLAPSLSHFGYNETVAHEYFPLKSAQALAFGAKWKEKDAGGRYEGKIFDLPESIENVPDDIIKQILTCISCNKNYKIILPELQFYRKIKVPVPKKCFECRHAERMQSRNPRHLWTRTCAKCSTSIQTSYSPDRPEIVYCESCYLKEIY